MSLAVRASQAAGVVRLQPGTLVVMKTCAREGRARVATG